MIFEYCVAEAYKLQYLLPYLALTKDQNIHPGVNFAVAGATALDTKFFIEAGLGKFLWTNNSLNIQLGWFKKLKPSLCTSKLGNTENQTKENTCMCFSYDVFQR